MTLHSDHIVFVFGALRSGTTVFRLMLDAHPCIANPGEMDFLFDFLRPDPSAPGGWYYDEGALRLSWIFRATGLEIDPARKGLDQLDYFLNQLRARHPEQILSINIHRHAEVIAQILPQARLIHILRDPRDVARSSIAMGWAGTLYHGVGHWIETETAWDAAAARIPKSQVLTLSYEDLFNETEVRLREVCSFLQVEYDSAMLRYHESTSYSAPDKALVQQWQHKCDPREIALLEYRAGGLMTRRGYALSGAQAPNFGTKVKLILSNKMKVWKFGINRFGVPIYLGEKATRWLGLKAPHRRLKLRMDNIATRHLK